VLIDVVQPQLQWSACLSFLSTIGTQFLGILHSPHTEFHFPACSSSSANSAKQKPKWNADTVLSLHILQSYYQQKKRKFLEVIIRYITSGSCISDGSDAPLQEICESVVLLFQVRIEKKERITNFGWSPMSSHTSEFSWIESEECPPNGESWPYCPPFYPAVFSCTTIVQRVSINFYIEGLLCEFSSD
jgi:hypothetical protein